jgi:predicted DNA-binding WGR domain protein
MSGAFPVGPSLWLTDTRYYILRVQCDLFGGWELLKAWGGRGNRRGRHQMIPAAHEAQAIDMFERECRRRLRRGYRRVTDSEGH